MKRKLQREYTDEAIRMGNGNTKEVWKRLKEVWLLKNKSTTIVELNGKSEAWEMAEEMNDFFANIGEELASEIQNTTPTFPGNIHPPTFSLTETNVNRIQELINGLNCSQSCDIDGLTARLMKDAGPTLTPIITHIFNLSLVLKVFPTTWKIALVSPIHKEGDKSQPSNYRPISLLSILSKMLEHWCMSN